MEPAFKFGDVVESRTLAGPLAHVKLVPFGPFFVVRKSTIRDNNRYEVKSLSNGNLDWIEGKNLRLALPKKKD